jgi:hypothetical protein
MAVIDDFTAVQYTEVLNQIATPKEFLGNTHFTHREDLATSNFRIPIYRGESVIQEAIAPGAPRPTYGDSAEHLLPATLARFAERKPITPSDIRRIRNLSSTQEQEETFASLINRRLTEIKNRFAATKEYLRMGAILGTVLDGGGNKLFEFKTAAAPLEFKGLDPENAFAQIEDAIGAEFGYNPGFIAYVSRGFFNKAWSYAIDNDLVQKGVVAKERLNENGSEVGVINYNGVLLRPITTNYNNKKGENKPFLAPNSAVFVPRDNEAFREYYTNAEHTKAMQSAATEYFSDVEELPEGQGYVLIAESVSLPVCVRPYAVRRAIWSD